MVKMNFSDNQTTFDYVLYMIAASYFDGAECRNKLLERSMMLQYKEQKLDTQCRMERICIDYMERLQKKFPAKFFRQKMQVCFRRKENGARDIYFVSDRYILKFAGIYDGRDTRINGNLWVKKPGSITHMPQAAECEDTGSRIAV